MFFHTLSQETNSKIKQVCMDVSSHHIYVFCDEQDRQERLKRISNLRRLKVGFNNVMDEIEFRYYDIYTHQEFEKACEDFNRRLDFEYIFSTETLEMMFTYRTKSFYTYMKNNASIYLSRIDTKTYLKRHDYLTQKYGPKVFQDTLMGLFQTMTEDEFQKCMEFYDNLKV